MKRSARLRGIAGAAAALAFTFTLAMPAEAAPAQHLSCTKESSPPSSSGKSTGILTGCTPAKTFKAGATNVFTTPPQGSKKGSLKGTYTWKGGKGKTIVVISFALQVTPRKCPLGTTRVTTTGKVTGGSGAAAKIIKKGEPVTGSICAYTAGANAGKTTIEPGTKFKM